MCSIRRICTIENCQNPYKASGLCNNHYAMNFYHNHKKLKTRENVNVTHHGRYLPEYNIWTKMLQRCYNPNDAGYYKYGARGITVCDRWKNIDGFENFILDMDWRINSEYSINRLNNDGPYSPDNCDWAKAPAQQANKRKPINNTSGYKGVTERNGKWRVAITADYNRINIGNYDDKIEAAIAYDQAAIFFRNYPTVTNFL